VNLNKNLPRSFPDKKPEVATRRKASVGSCFAVKASDACAWQTSKRWTTFLAVSTSSHFSIQSNGGCIDRQQVIQDVIILTLVMARTLCAWDPCKVVHVLIGILLMLIAGSLIA
jgi:hypothetical protein